MDCGLPHRRSVCERYPNNFETRLGLVEQTSRETFPNGIVKRVTGMVYVTPEGCADCLDLGVVEKMIYVHDSTLETYASALQRELKRKGFEFKVETRYGLEETLRPASQNDTKIGRTD